MKKESNTNTRKLLNFQDSSKLSELTPREIISALIEANTQDEVDILYWRNVDAFEKYPVLTILLKNVRKRLSVLRHYRAIFWTINLN